MATYTRIVSDWSHVRALEKYGYRTLLIVPYDQKSWWVVQERPDQMPDATAQQVEAQFEGA